MRWRRRRRFAGNIIKLRSTECCLNRRADEKEPPDMGFLPHAVQTHLTGMRTRPLLFQRAALGWCTSPRPPSKTAKAPR